MQKHRSKRYRAAAEKVDAKKKYPLAEAVTLALAGSEAAEAWSGATV